MLVVHHLAISLSERIIWLCEELQIAYQLKHYDRDPQTRLAPVDYKALHVSGTSPVITDGDIALAESGAIVEYILNKYGNGRLVLKPDHPNYVDYLYWFHFATGTFVPGMWMKMVGNSLNAESPIVNLFLKRFTLAFDLIEDRLGAVDYFAGNEFTAADILMVFPLTTGRVFAPVDLTPYPNIRAYLKRIGARPAYQEAMKKSDPGFTPLLE